MRLLTITTDFGTVDGYVGEMKGVILNRAPDLRIIDITHDLAQGDIRAGVWVLSRIWTRYPEKVVHLAVVDPGVGTDRRGIAVRVRDRWLVAPDNGLLSGAEASASRGPEAAMVEGEQTSALRVQEAREIAEERIGLEPFSDTFHGRDLFAPAAALLASGSPPESIGPAIDPDGLARLPVDAPRREGSQVRGVVLHVDRFGNLITNVPAACLPPSPVLEIGTHRVRHRATSYAAIPSGRAALIRGSGGTVEIATRGRRADRELEARRGDPVRLRSADE